MPQRDAGMRMEPPVSEPSAAGQNPAATAAADPPLDPPGVRDRSQGFRTDPAWGFALVTPYANSWRPVLPTITAPASRSRVMTGASSRAMVWKRLWATTGVGIPAM